MTYLKRGPFSNGSASPPIDAAFLNGVETELVTLGTASSPAASGSDDTSVLTTWLTGLTGRKSATITGSFKISATLTVPAGLTLDARGALFTGTGTAAFDMIRLSAGSRLIGAELAGGTRTGGNGVVLNAITGGQVTDCYIHDLAGTGANDGRGISVGSGSTKYLIRGNRIENVNGQGISLDTANRGRIVENQIDTAEHGIQWWGSDPAVGGSSYISHLVIAENSIRNVQGGIWGAMGQFITVTGNDVDTCSDVGIDFEGGSDCTAAGNTVTECANAGLAVFYGAKRITFTGNTVTNTTSTGPAFKAFTTTTNANIRLTGNELTTSGIVINCDTGALSFSSISGNTITRTVPGNTAVRLQAADNMIIQDNDITLGGATGISFEGGSDSQIEGNRILTYVDSSAAGGGTAGIYNYWSSAAAPAKRNRIRFNTIRGFVQSIFDDCWGDNQSATLVEFNIANAIYGRSGTNAVFNGNRNDTTHATVAPTSR